MDRGPDGIDIIFDMMRHTNIIPLIGNHDEMAKINLPKYMNCEDMLSVEEDEDIFIWFLNGGQRTVDAFMRLSIRERHYVLEYLNTFKTHAEINVDGMDYLLVHSAPDKPGKKFDDWELDDIIWGRPDYTVPYFDDRTLVTGHTPTELINIQYKGRIYKKHRHIAIDCGAVFVEGRLGCICLNNMEEYYITKDKSINNGLH